MGVMLDGGQEGLVVPEAGFCAPVCKLQGRQTFMLFSIWIKMTIFKSASKARKHLQRRQIQSTPKIMLAASYRHLEYSRI